MNSRKPRRHFGTAPQADVPQGRSGKHKAIVTAIIEDLDLLEKGSAIKIPLSELNDSKENVRSALNRATRKMKRNVATAADAQFLYVWTTAD